MWSVLFLFAEPHNVPSVTSWCTFRIYVWGVWIFYKSPSKGFLFSARTIQTTYECMWHDYFVRMNRIFVLIYVQWWFGGMDWRNETYYTFTFTHTYRSIMCILHVETIRICMWGMGVMIIIYECIAIACIWSQNAHKTVWYLQMCECVEFEMLFARQYKSTMTVDGLFYFTSKSVTGRPYRQFVLNSF